MITTTPRTNHAELPALNEIRRVAERDELSVTISDAPRVLISYEVWLGKRDLAVVGHKAGDQTWLYFSPLDFSWKYTRGLKPDNDMEEALRGHDLLVVRDGDHEGINSVLDVWTLMVRQWSETAREQVSDDG